MDIALTKKHIAAVRPEPIPTPLAVISEAFTANLLARLGRGVMTLNMVPLEYLLEESDELAAPAPVYDIHLDLNFTARKDESANNFLTRERVERVLERLVEQHLKTLAVEGQGLKIVETNLHESKTVRGELVRETAVAKRGPATPGLKTDVSIFRNSVFNATAIHRSGKAVPQRWEESSQITAALMRPAVLPGKVIALWRDSAIRLLPPMVAGRSGTDAPVRERESPFHTAGHDGVERGAPINAEIASNEVGFKSSGAAYAPVELALQDGAADEPGIQAFHWQTEFSGRLLRISETVRKTLEHSAALARPLSAKTGPGYAARMLAAMPAIPRELVSLRRAGLLYPDATRGIPADMVFPRAQAAPKTTQMDAPPWRRAKLPPAEIEHLEAALPDRSTDTAPRTEKRPTPGRAAPAQRIASSYPLESPVVRKLREFDIHMARTLLLAFRSAHEAGASGASAAQAAPKTTQMDAPPWRRAKLPPAEIEHLEAALPDRSTDSAPRTEKRPTPGAAFGRTAFGRAVPAKKITSSHTFESRTVRRLRELDIRTAHTLFALTDANANKNVYEVSSSPHTPVPGERRTLPPPVPGGLEYALPGLMDAAGGDAAPIRTPEKAVHGDEALPGWARDFFAGKLPSASVQPAKTTVRKAMRPSGTQTAAQSFDRTSGAAAQQTVWTAPGYTPPAKLAHRGKDQEQEPPPQARIGDAEINRLASRVYSVLEERISREWRRAGR